MTLIVDQLCDRHGYPSLVRTHLKAIQEVIASTPGVLAAVLTGSAARGELSVFADELGQVRVFSDYEFLVISRAKQVSAVARELGKNLEVRSSLFAGRTPLTAAEVAVRSRAGAQTLPKTLWVHETATNGVCVVGKGGASHPRLPRVTLANLDYGELNEVLLWRLVALAKHASGGILAPGRSASEEFLSAYLMARNALDCLTWILPHMGILLPSYRDRLNALKRNHDHPFVMALGGNNFVELQERALHVKLNGNDGASAAEWYCAVIETFSRCLGLHATLPRRRAGFTDLRARRLVAYARRSLRGESVERDGYPILRWRAGLLDALMEWHVAAVSTVRDGSHADAILSRSCLEIVQAVARRTPWMQIPEGG